MGKDIEDRLRSCEEKGCYESRAIEWDGNYGVPGKCFFLILLGSGNKCIPKLAEGAEGASTVRGDCLRWSGPIIPVCISYH